MLVCLKKLWEHDERKHITTKEVAKQIERAGIYTPDPPRGSADYIGGTLDLLKD